MANGLVGFSADKGELLWRTEPRTIALAGTRPTFPRRSSRGTRYSLRPATAEAQLITLSSSGGKFDVKEEYWNKNLTNKHGGVLMAGDYLYGDRDDSGRPWCAEFKTGAVKWSRDRNSKGGGSASMTFADGKLYIRYADGWVTLVDPKTSYEEISSFKVPNGTNDCLAHPVVVGGKLLIRERTWSGAIT